MQVTFLSADTPLVKTFTLVNGVIEKTPYPNAYLFTSHTYNLETLSDMLKAMREEAALGRCLLKGKLLHELQNESRAGSTQGQDTTEWGCFDLDGISRLNTPEKFMAAVGLSDISYIVQYSASMGIDKTENLSAHIFFMLSGPVAAPFLKSWLTHVNLNVKELHDETRLTRTGNALHWPLDITGCQNDKLLFIAPPKLVGLKDTLPLERIRLVKNRLDSLPTNRITCDVNRVRKQAKDRLNELRKESGLTTLKDAQYKVKNNVSYLSKPGEGVITGQRVDRGFVYFNLNGGDSWAYYHPENNPEFIYNFKGEPTYRTEELLPDYWKSLSAQGKDEYAGSREYFAIRDFRTDRFFNGYFDTDSQELTIAKAATETRLRSFLKQHGQPVPDFVPDWDIVYDPQSEVKYDPENKIINTYAPSQFYALEQRQVLSVPATIQKVIDHAVGGGEETAWFINWLAYIVQFRKPTTTSWTLHGNQGTGKGLLFHNIIAPMLGDHNVHSMLMGGLQSQFNSWVETALVVFVDEVQFSKLMGSEQVVAAIKSYTTEPMVSVRRMHCEAYRAKNHVNFIFASNQPDPVVIETTDRRNNVGKFQSEKLEITEADIRAIDRELEDFFMFLRGYAVNEQQARTVLVNDDRKLLISINRTSVDEVADAILSGDLEYLLDQLPNSDDPIFMTPAANAYKALMENILRNGETDASLTRDELFIVYDYCVGNTPRSPNKFTSMLKHHRIYTHKIRRGDNLYYGIGVRWKHSKEWFEERRAALAPKRLAPVTNIQKAKING
jgi:hypothetical protein